MEEVDTAFWLAKLSSNPSLHRVNAEDVPELPHRCRALDEVGQLGLQSIQRE